MKPSNHAIEDWAKEVQNSKKREFTKQESKDFIRYHLIELNGGVEADEETMKSLENKQAGYSSAIWFRVKCYHTYEILATLAFYLGEQVITNFGISVMLANYLQFVAHEHNLKKIGMREFSLYAFPMGIPEESEWQRLWELQKIDGEATDDKYRGMVGNGLDHAALGESIREISAAESNESVID